MTRTVAAHADQRPTSPDRLCTHAHHTTACGHSLARTVAADG